MPSAKNPVFRKAIFPWHHSKTAYWITIVCMLVVFLFGWAGISVARANTEYNGYVWVPIVLVVLSGGVILVNIMRLIRRRGTR